MSKPANSSVRNPECEACHQEIIKHLKKDIEERCHEDFRRENYFPLALCIGFVFWLVGIFSRRYEAPVGFFPRVFDFLFLAAGSALASGIIAIFFIVADFVIEYMKSLKEKTMYALIICTILALTVIAALL